MNKKQKKPKRDQTEIIIMFYVKYVVIKRKYEIYQLYLIKNCVKYNYNYFIFFRGSQVIII